MPGADVVGVAGLEHLLARRRAEREPSLHDDPDVLGKLGFIGIAQSAGFKLREISELITGIDGADGLGTPMRVLSTQKLDEIEALLERTKVMKGWLEVAQECGCATPAECALFPSMSDHQIDPDLALTVIDVDDCRRPPAS